MRRKRNARNELEALIAERDELRAALRDLMPFVEEPYYRIDEATSEFKAVVEKARKAIKR